jgi:hypothetical protein
MERADKNMAELLRVTSTATEAEEMVECVIELAKLGMFPDDMRKIVAAAERQGIIAFRAGSVRYLGKVDWQGEQELEG